MTKPLASLLLSVCLGLPTWIGRDVGALDGDDIEQETQNARDRDVALVDRYAIDQEIRNARQERNVTVDRDAIEEEIRDALRESHVAKVDPDAIEQEIRNALQKNVTVDRDAIEQEIRSALRELETELPELLKSIRINVQVPEINVQIPEIHVPEIQIPKIHVQAPTEVQIPEINIPEIKIPEIRIQIPKIDLDTRETRGVPKSHSARATKLGSTSNPADFRIPSQYPSLTSHMRATLTPDFASTLESSDLLTYFILLI